MNEDFLDFVNDTLSEHKYETPGLILKFINNKFNSIRASDMGFYELETYVCFVYSSLSSIKDDIDKLKYKSALDKYKHAIDELFEKGTPDHHTHMGFYMKGLISYCFHYDEDVDEPENDYHDQGYDSYVSTLHELLSFINAKDEESDFVYKFTECYIYNMIEGYDSDVMDGIFGFMSNNGITNKISPVDGFIMIPFTIDIVMSDADYSDICITVNDEFVNHGVANMTNCELYVWMNFCSKYHESISNYESIKYLLKEVSNRLTSSSVNEEFKEAMWSSWCTLYVFYLSHTGELSDIEDISRFDPELLVYPGDIHINCIDRIMGRTDDDQLICALKEDLDFLLSTCSDDHRMKTMQTFTDVVGSFLYAMSKNGHTKVETSNIL